MRYFNTAGPCDPVRHYMVPPEPRLPSAQALVDQGSYFTLHAPRQTGKTTTLRSLAQRLTADGDYAALLFSCETAEPAQENYVRAQNAILDSIQRAAEIDLPEDLRPPASPTVSDESKLSAALSAWARTCPRPLVLFIDEIDAVRGESLRSVLSQLRDGFRERPQAFPHSVVLCGLRDVRDYRVASGGDPNRLGTSSPFNITVASLRLGDFTPDDITSLYAQHTAETGQEFTPEALDAVWDASAGQPWLVNALAREIVEEMAVPAEVAITAEHITTARERLIRARATHRDSLVDKLHEPRVRRVLEPIIAGDLLVTDPTYDDDVSYVRDLGLIAADKPIRVANSIYREIIVRVLAARTEDVVVAEPRSFVKDGRIDLPMILNEFADFWREHGDVLARRDAYHEAAPQLVLMGYLHRIVNGGGFVDREYGVGRGRIDVLIKWPWTDNNGTRRIDRHALELKVWRDGKPDPLTQGLRQLDSYCDRLSLDTATLILFDRRTNTDPIETRTQFDTATSPAGRTITVLRA